MALGVLAMTVGLIRIETARDLRTLTAAGARRRTRRALTAATAGALALGGAIIGTACAYLAGWLLAGREARVLTRQPLDWRERRPQASGRWSVVSCVPVLVTCGLTCRRPAPADSHQQQRAEGGEGRAGPGGGEQC